MDRSGLVPTEDTIEALLDHLVDPLLPIVEVRGEVPNDHQQLMLAKQMHAVVILYNYYHLKQFPKLEFLGLESFCKLCCIAKPAILYYLRYMHGCEEGSDNINNQFSITEKMIMDACNICIELDSSKDNPIIQGWPISKVAVFLVDPTNKKSLLQFCSITQGVWSLVEKAVEARYENGFSENEPHEFEKVLDQLAFSSVEQETGINRSDLSILERHLTYSLSHEKTTAQLYIMKYERALSEELPEVAIEDVIRSLEGPLVKKDLTCEVTSVIEYYNILPYIDIIASWLARENANHDSLDMLGQKVIEEEKCSLQLNGVASVADREACWRDSVGCITKYAVEDAAYDSGAIQGGFSSDDLPLVPMHVTSSEHNAFYHAMASKENDLLQASLRVFQKKRDDLYQQKRLLQDEIARCEMNIQKILREGDESSTLAVDSIVEALNSLSSSQVQACLSQNTKRRKFSKAVLSSLNSCQELDDVCHKNNWILPRYTVFPSLADCASTGMFKATVSVHGTDFECTNDGDLSSSPHEARESAATHILKTLQTLQSRIEKQ